MTSQIPYIQYVYIHTPNSIKLINDIDPASKQSLPIQLTQLNLCITN